MKQIAMRIICSILVLPIFSVSTFKGIAQAQTTTVKTRAQTANTQLDPMTTLKKVGDNLDNSMKAVSSDVHKKLDEGGKNTARTSKQMEQTPAVKSMEKAGNEFGKEVNGFGNNLGKKMNSSLPKSGSMTNSKNQHTGANLQKNASNTFHNAGKAIDDSVKKLKSK
jgi:NADH dehydrogenase/NADH:ubiquinone oxidoreductase subunit G